MCIRDRYSLDETKNQFILVPIDCVQKEDISIRQILETTNGLLLASSAGVIQYDEILNTCKVYPLVLDSITQAIQFIHEDNIAQEILWLGTQRAGIVKWNTKTDTYSHFNTSNGLSNNAVHAIIEDTNERLWISTNRNLNCLNKKTEDISIFTEQDGISHSEFNRFSYFYDTIQNNIYFGGLNGYTYFNPDSILTEKSESKIQLRLTDAIKTKDDATTENLFQGLITSKTIEFHESDVSLILSLSTNHLANSKNKEYSYRIPGIIDEWKTQSSNDIKLNRLPYGEYKVEFIADLNKPSFTSSILSLDLKVIQPFTKTWTFYLLSAISFFLLIWFANQKYLASVKERNLRLERIVEERTQELSELNSQKNKLFTILAHDLKNPISSLTNITDKIQFLTKRNRLDEIEILTKQTKAKINALNDNLNNVLVWAINENNVLTQDPQKYSIHHEVNKILTLYSVDIEEKNLSINLTTDPIDQVFLDISVLQTILRNYINNAIKFSYNDSALLIYQGAENRGRYELRIEDHGIGIINSSDQENPNAKKIRAIGKGSGIGMRICSDLALKADIKIKIISKSTGGSIVVLDLPQN